MNIADDSLAIRFGGERLGLSARRLWEHVELRQLNPFQKSPLTREFEVDEFIDVVDLPGTSNTLTGVTLADLRRGHYSDLPRPLVETLLRHTRQQVGQRWLRNVEELLTRAASRRALRNVPAEFIPTDTRNSLGITGLKLSLVDWLEKYASDKATSEQWSQRIKNLASRGLSADELDHCGISRPVNNGASMVLYGHQIVQRLTYDGVLLSILPFLQQAGRHTRFVSIQEDVAAKRIKPKLKKRVPTRPRFQDKTLGYWIDVVNWDDLLGPQNGWLAFTHRGEPITGPNNPSGLCRFPEEAMKLADNHARQVMPRMSTKGRWSDHRLTGGQNYREWLITLPEYKQGFFSSHFDYRNILFHVRCDVREDQLGNQILFLEEVQSDWVREARRSVRERDTWPDRVPKPPWLKEWTSLALKLMLLHAAHNGLAGLAWTPGSVHIKRWGSADARAMRQLYDQMLPKALNQALRFYGRQCESIDVYLPVNFHVEPEELGYTITDADGNLLGQAATWEQVEKLLPDGAHERLTTMHGVRLDKQLREEMLINGFFAWGGGISQL